MKSEFDALLQREMDRKEFLKLVGVGLLALTGLASLSEVWTALSYEESAPVRSFGYGRSPYGGHKKA